MPRAGQVCGQVLSCGSTKWLFGSLCSSVERSCTWPNRGGKQPSYTIAKPSLIRAVWTPGDQTPCLMTYNADPSHMPEHHHKIVYSTLKCVIDYALKRDGSQACSSQLQVSVESKQHQHILRADSQWKGTELNAGLDVRGCKAASSQGSSGQSDSHRTAYLGRRFQCSQPGRLDRQQRPAL